MKEHIGRPHLEEFLKFYFEEWPRINQSIDKTQEYGLFGDSQTGLDQFSFLPEELKH